MFILGKKKSDEEQKMKLTAYQIVCLVFIITVSTVDAANQGGTINWFYGGSVRFFCYFSIFWTQMNPKWCSPRDEMSKIEGSRDR